MKPPVLKGGQGRTEADLTNDLVAMCCTVLVCLAILIAAWGCS